MAILNTKIFLYKYQYRYEYEDKKMTTSISSIITAATDPLALTPKTAEGILEYDENGKVIGLKKAEEENKKTQTKAKDNSNVQMNVMKYQEDVFVRQTEKEEEEKTVKADEAKKQKVNIDDAYRKFAKAISFDDSTLLKKMKDENVVTQREISNLHYFNKKLMSADASDTTVIESVKSFVDKAKRLQETAEEYEEAQKEEKNSINPFSAETVEDKYIEDNNLEVDTVSIKDEDLLENNFFMSAMETSEVEDKDAKEEEENDKIAYANNDDEE